MPCKKKKYNARFPAGRIKKIMQTDEEVGKVAQAVPVIISRTLELFVHSLLTKTMQITNARNAKTLRPSHMKQCILSENRFDFLKDLVKGVPDVSGTDDDVPTPPLTPAPMGVNVAMTGPAPIVHSDGRVSEGAPNWSRTSSRNSRNSKDVSDIVIVGGGDPEEYTKVFVPGMPGGTTITEPRSSSLPPTQELLHQHHQHQEHHHQVPSFQITLPSSFHVNQPNFYTELDPTSNNNNDLGTVDQPTSNFNHTANIDEDYDT